MLERLRLRQGEFQNRRQKLEEAFLFEKAIGQEVFRRQAALLEKKLAAIEEEMDQSAVPEFEIRDILAFAAEVLVDLTALWESSEFNVAG